VRLEELHRTLRDELLDARLAAGEHARLLPDLEAAATADPLHERPHRMLAVALYRCGRITDAVQTLRRYRTRHVEETGLDPTDELAVLESALLAGDPALRPQSAAAPAAARTALLAAPANPFFGRVGEREALQAALRAQRLVTVTGPGGVGKTRLVLELLAETTAPVVLLDLASLHDGADVLAALATGDPAPVRPRAAAPRRPV
jgi:Bacterial transcriptional activator domain